MDDRLNNISGKLEYLSAGLDSAAEPSCTVGIATLGCKVNQYESAALEEDLQKKDFLLVPFNTIADFYIINTCTVTAFSAFQVRQLIRRAHRTNPQAKIVVTGCYAQVAPQDIAILEGVSMVVGNDRKNGIADLLRSHTDLSSSSIFVNDIFRQNKFYHMPIRKFRGHTRAFLKIQDGCNSFCSYCIVPFARGNSRSLAPQEVFTALAALNQEGYKEIVLTGIHLGTYGYDLEPATNIAQILEQLCRRQCNARIRLSSIEPREITAELLNVIENNDLLCPHLHIPLQSGDDKILQLMKRDYNQIFYRNLIEKICSTISDVAIGVDVMVGFPTESEEQFNNTFNLLDSLPVAYLHVFPYSARPGTPAEKMQPHIPANVKNERAAILRNLSAQKREKFALRFLDKPLKVVVESTRDKKTGLLKGFSQNYLPVLLDGDFSSSVNNIVTIKANKYLNGKLYGKIAD
jgi:threonylcarbamoyladenosine tRNA methylthiotransferase MtaB